MLSGQKQHFKNNITTELQNCNVRKPESTVRIQVVCLNNLFSMLQIKGRFQILKYHQIKKIN